VHEDLAGLYGWATDQDGELRAALSYRNRKVRMKVRDIETGKWHFIDRIFGEESAVKFDYDAETLTNRHCTLLGFGYNSDIVYIGSNLDNDTTGIYAFDLKKGEIIETIAEHEAYDLVETDAASDLSVLRFCRLKKTLIGFDTWFHARKSVWLDSDYQAVQSMIDGALPGRQNYIGDWDDAAKVFLINSWDSNDPGRTYALDLATSQLVEIASSMPWIDPAKMSKKYPITINARDGLKLNGYLTIPVDQVSKPLPMNLPLVVYPHGGPWARNYGYFEARVQLLASRG
jgi:dipeptidyl aminopeptidase/acylaminoacyl peptidase